MKFFLYYFLIFIIYAILGWCIEVVFCSLIDKKLTSRGFLIGPYCPIYGWAALLMILSLHKYIDDPIIVFIMGAIIASVLEYITSFFMEKIFHARWWDYSTKTFNINGRICLETMLPFGILGCLVVYVLHPFVISLVNLLSPKIMIILSILLFLVYLVDSIISFNVMNKIKGEIKKAKIDNTELIRKKVSEWLGGSSFLYRHILNSYPRFKINVNPVKMIRKKLKI